MSTPVFNLNPNHRNAASLSRQSGLSLAVVLISLLIMGLAAVGLTRMVDAGTIIIGNVGFKQHTTAAADRGMEAAVQFLQAQTNLGNDLSSDVAGQGYYASVRPLLDATWSQTTSPRALPDWGGGGCGGAEGSGGECLATAGDNQVQPDGSQVRYLIIRLCDQAGDASQWALRCMRPLANDLSYVRPANALDYSAVWSGTGVAPPPIYRVIVRATGPRNTVSFTDTYVQF